jgi:hypothetical protein
MILSSVGVFLVWTTFNATRDANRIAEASANAALAHAKEENRAWMQVVITHPTARIIEGDLLIDCFVYGKNIGVKPALRPRIIFDDFNAGFGNDSGDDRGRLLGMIHTQGVPQGVIFPDQTTTGFGASWRVPLNDMQRFNPRLNVCIAYQIAGVEGERYTLDGFDIHADGMAEPFHSTLRAFENTKE